MSRRWKILHFRKIFVNQIIPISDEMIHANRMIRSKLSRTFL